MRRIWGWPAVFMHILSPGLGTLAASMTLLPGGRVRATTVTVEHIDGTRFTAEWLGCVEAGSVRLGMSDGEASFSLNDLSEIIFDAARPRTGARAADSGCQVSFLLADGGSLCGEIREGAKDGVRARTALGSEVVLPFDRLAGVKLASSEEHPRADELFRAALESALPGRDVLVTREGDKATVLRGRLEALDGDGGSFELSGRTRRFKSENVFGVVFATGALEARAYPARIELDDGSIVAGRPQGGDGDRLRFEPSIGGVVELPVARLARITLSSNRVVYVSDLASTDERVQGIMHSPWPVRRDLSCSMRKLSIGGRVFEKGIGCHSRTVLSYDLRGAYVLFAATIGIDDAVRPRGSVVFRVLGDGEVLFESDVLTGRTAPQDLSVDVAGVDQLALVVDYGDGLDLSDHADWGGARLIRRAIPAEHEAP